MYFGIVYVSGPNILLNFYMKFNARWPIRELWTVIADQYCKLFLSYPKKPTVKHMAAQPPPRIMCEMQRLTGPVH